MVISQAGIINVIDNNPTIPIYFEGDTGFAVALFNTIIFAGAGGIVTSATGNTVTIDGSGIAFDLTLTGDTGGPLSPTADNFNILGGSGAAGTTPVQVNGAISTLTVNVQKAQAIAATNATNVGLAAFDSAFFSVDANGFVSFIGGGGGTVTSVSGTANRITSTGGTTPVIDIAATYVGQTSITTLGTITTGVWNGSTVTEGFGGTNQTTYATGDLLYASGANTLAKRAIGATATVLTVAGGVPTWQAIPSASFTVNIQTFTANGTYTPTTGMDYCIIEIVGSGGGGGGSDSTTGVQVAYGGGGAGGEYARGVFSAATIGASQAVTCPAGGAGGTAGNNNGTTGSTTSVGSLISAGGGGGGAGSPANGTGNSIPGGIGGTGGTGGSVRFPGQAGRDSNWIFGTFQRQGTGAPGPFSGGTRGSVSTGTGATGTGYGGGGGGGQSFTSAAAQAGGAGSSGFVVITEYILT